MAASRLTENIRKIQVPRQLAQRSNGFAIDIGGSVVKLVYLSKDEWREDEASPNRVDNNSNTVNLYMTSCAKEHIDGAIEFIKSNVYIRHLASGEQPIIYTTGIGSNVLTTRFIKEFNVQISNTMEFTSFIRAIDFFSKNYPASQVFADFPAGSFQDGIKQAIASTRIMEAWMEIGEQTLVRMDKEKLATVKTYLESMKEKLDRGESVENETLLKYPYILGQFGSGFVYLKVYEDHTCRIMDLTPFAGRSFIDLGRLLTGAKTYEELIALAGKGSEDRLNVRMCDVVHDVQGDVYSSGLEEETVIYSFGKAHGKELDEVNREDIARTLLHEICANVLKTGIHVMTRENCCDLFLAGSFVGSPVTQQILTKRFEVLRTECSELGTAQVTMADLKMRIIREGAMLGALGTFLTGCD